MSAKLTEAQRTLLGTIPDDWVDVPIMGDSRPRQPLINAGMVELRKTDVTPKEWDEPRPCIVRSMRHEWRRTDTGRAYLAALASSAPKGET